MTITEFPLNPDSITYRSELDNALNLYPHYNLNTVTALNSLHITLLQIKKFGGKRITPEQKQQLDLRLRKTKELIYLFTYMNN